MTPELAEDGALRAGAYHVDTTPELGAELGGYFQPRIADVVERPLEAKALALQSGDTTLLLISCDILMMRAADIVDEAKARITAATGVPASHILVSATHTHSGPATVERVGGVRVDPAYIARLTTAIAEAGIGATERLTPARLGFGQAPVSGVCFNRRFLRTDGLVQFNPGRNRTDLVGPAGPTDPTVTGLVVEQTDGTPLAFWANLSLHYVNAGSPTAISSDYYGAFAERLAGLYGGTVPAQLTNGCSGDINNVDLAGSVPEQGVLRAEMVASAVVGAALAGTMMAERHTRVELSSQLLEVELDRASATEEDARIAAEIAAGQRKDAPFSWHRGMPIPEDLVPYYAQRFTDLAARPERATVPVTIMTIGELCIVGLPGEIFVEHGLAIRHGSRYRHTAVVGLANDHIGYVPTARGHAQGGYESWRDGVSWTTVGSGERLVAAVLAEISDSGSGDRLAG